MPISMNNTTLTFNNGTTMTTAATGTVSSVATGNGLTGGTITTSGTISLDVYTGSNVNNTSFPIGTVIQLASNFGSVNCNAAVQTIYCSSGNAYRTTDAGYGALAGTWRSRGIDDVSACMICQRTA